MKKQKTVEPNPILQDDILRYKKNKFAANFALLALVFNCLYFMLFYSVHNESFYTILLGFSVILNLLVLLLGFFCSEGIKGFNGKFAYVLFALAAVQIARIFVFPLMGMSNDWLTGNFYFGIPMNSPLQGILLIVYLCASSACFIVSGVQGLIAAKRLQNFQKRLDNGEISVEATLKELDEKDAAAAVVTADADMSENNTADGEVQAEPAVESAEEASDVKTDSTEEADNG